MPDKRAMPAFSKPPAELADRFASVMADRPRRRTRAEEVTPTDRAAEVRLVLTAA